MQYVFNEPKEYSFKDTNGHRGKRYRTSSPITEHLIIECDDKLTVSQLQREVEFDYYVLQGSGYFVLDGDKHYVNPGDLVIIPPGTKYTFGGKLKMLLINTPHWSAEQQKVFK